MEPCIVHSCVLSEPDVHTVHVCRPIHYNVGFLSRVDSFLSWSHGDSADPEKKWGLPNQDKPPEVRYRQKEMPELFSWEFSCNQLAHRESIACNWL